MSFFKKQLLSEKHLGMQLEQTITSKEQTKEKW